MDALMARLIATLQRLAFGAALLVALTARAEPEEPIYVDLRLMGADLVDELVYSWLAEPPLTKKTTVVLADVSAPVGLDDRFAILVENRLYELLRQNASVPVELAHCAICTRLVAKSTPAGTVIGRGIDQPEVLERLAADSGERLALALAFEAESRDLVLRATLFELGGAQRVVWAKAFSTSLSARRALRETAPLVSLETARANQQALLEGRDRIEITTRLAMRQFNLSNSALTVAPLLFLEQSFEAMPLPDRKLRAAVTLGFTSIKDSMEAWSVGGHVARLIGGAEPALAVPDLYWFFGAHFVRMRGPGAAPFGESQIDLARTFNLSKEPRASLTTWRLGLEAHIKYKLGMMAFIEYVPVLNKRDEVFEQSRLIGIPYHLIGWGAVIRW